MKKNIKHWSFYIIGGILGAIGGYFYWKLVGCQGNCYIWSSHWKSALTGLLLGALGGGSLYDLIDYLQKKKQHTTLE